MQANAATIVIARESRGLRQTELARLMSERLGEPVSQGYVSKAEAGRLAITDERLQALSDVLRYPITMLCRAPRDLSVGVGLVHHRKRASLGALVLRRIQAQLAVTRTQVDNLLDLDVRPELKLHRYTLTAEDTPSEIAERVRTAWKLGHEPIPDLVSVIEGAGSVVLCRSFDTTDLDAVSQWPEGEVPLILLDPQAPADRFRLSLAHELGHLLLHHQPGPTHQHEKQADEFASAFLLPTARIRPELRRTPIDLQRLMELKAIWGVSMAALARRAVDLGAVSEWRYRDLMVEMSMLGYRKQEPAAITYEYPSALTNMIADHIEHRGTTIEELATIAGLFPDEFTELYLTKPSF